MVHKNRMKYEETKTIKIIPEKKEWRFQSPKLKRKQQPTVLQKILALYFHFRVRIRETISKTQMTQYHVLVISQIFPTCWWYIDADQLLPKRFCHLFSPMFRIKTNTKRECVCVCARLSCDGKFSNWSKSCGTTSAQWIGYEFLRFDASFICFQVHLASLSSGFSLCLLFCLGLELLVLVSCLLDNCHTMVFV